MKDAFDLTNVPVVNSFLKLDKQGLPSAESIEFPTYSEHEIKQLYNHYGRRKEDTFQERTVTTDALLDVLIDALLIEYAGFKNYVARQKVALSEEYTDKEKSLKAKYLIVDSQKNKMRKEVQAIEELELATKRKSNPLSVEDLLQDNVVETEFLHARRLMKMHALIAMSEAIVESGFSKMRQIMTKKRTALDDNSL